jgi:4-carboxymuconolactone decarboxylase
LKRNRLTYEKAFRCKIKDPDAGPVSALREELSNRDRAVEALGAATQSAGPLDSKTRALVKLAIAVGPLREGAVHSHTRRALEVGCPPDELRHVGVLAITTIGFPSTMAAMSWVEDILRTK